MEKPNQILLTTPICVNGIEVTSIIIGRHYLKKHAAYMTDAIIVDLVMCLDGLRFKPDSSTRGIEYFAADLLLTRSDHGPKIYRLVWLFEGATLEIIGVVNAYRVKKSKKMKEEL